jgi:DNA-binding HxlR family transcriptional regulator
MAALDLMGQRWVLRILWELREGPLTFRALQDACEGPSPTVLNTRLKALREANLVVHDRAAGYRLTAQGASLMSALNPLLSWSEGWAKSPGNTGD